MFIYNYLFFHGYLLALKSRSNRDMPFFIPFMLVLLCFIMHLFSISMFINGMGADIVFFKPEHRYYWVAFLMLIVAGSYLYRGRYKKLLENIANKHRPKMWVSILVVIVYYLVSSGIMLLTALYKNKDWIFG